jgi:hypothetical protein
MKDSWSFLASLKNLKKDYSSKKIKIYFLTVFLLYFTLTFSKSKPFLNLKLSWAKLTKDTLTKQEY